MNSQHIRIFLTTSQISAVYAMMLSEATRSPGDVDVLFADGSRRKKSLIGLISKTAALYKWDLFHDFSIAMEEDFDFNPSTTKSITRKIKTWPLISSIYNLLLERHYARIDKAYRDKLKKVLEPYLNEHTTISLFMLTQTYLNRPLRQLFPNAEINYLEHGMGDYYYMLDPKTPKGNFYCLFAESFKKYLAKKKNASTWVKQLPGLASFSEISNRVIAEEKINVPAQSNEKPYVYILMEAVDMYNVDESFWVAYMDHILQKVPSPNEYHFLLKPHPVQSQFSITATEEHFKKLGLQYTMLSPNKYGSASAEILFESYSDKTRHVFCLFSSACFYLSQLYKHKKIEFWYSTEFMSRHTGNAPSQFKHHFDGLCPIIEDVFSENCKPY
jgi:hypothetical protein